MKLRNKKTGEIKELQDILSDMIDNHIVPTLIAVENEWEDYEEPKEYWCIDWTGGINHITVLDDVDEYEESKKEIGNYFETKEEAEKAVEKLKAWKRLKDKGFRLKGLAKTYLEMDCIEFDIGSEYLRERDLRGSELNKDLDLLFGGEK